MPALLFFFLALFVVAPVVHAAQHSQMIDELNLHELEETFDDSKINALLGDSGAGLEKSERRSAAVLVSAGILNIADLAHSAQVAKKFEQFKKSHTGKSDHLIGPFGAGVTQSRLDRIGDHDELLKETKFIDSLHRLLRGRCANIGRGQRRGQRRLHSPMNRAACRLNFVGHGP